MKTYWSYEVCVDGRCVCSCGDETVSGAITRALPDAVYYQAVYPTSSIVIQGIQESCSRCHNEGTVLLKRPRSILRVKCPECKGKPATGKLDPIPFTMPDPANRITLAMA